MTSTEELNMNNSALQIHELSGPPEQYSKQGALKLLEIPAVNWYEHGALAAAQWDTTDRQRAVSP